MFPPLAKTILGGNANLMNIKTLYLAAAALLAAACTDSLPYDDEMDSEYVGKAVGNFAAEEWYPGGALGTTSNIAAGCYQDIAPAASQEGMTTAFYKGERMFRASYSENSSSFPGLGPAYVRTSCMDCHPGYGHGQRITSYDTSSGSGNGCLLVAYHPDADNPNDGPFATELTAMPQTQAVAPFLPPIDGAQVRIEWKTVAAMESGLPLQFPDGEAYELIYPEVSIPSGAFHTSPVPQNLAFRLESTIGINGTGLLDAIDQDSIRRQYAATAAYAMAAGRPELINTDFWDIAANDFAPGALYALADGVFADGTAAKQGTKALKRFTYAMTRASLQDGPGANALWNITNVSRADRPFLYTTEAWARAMSENDEVIDRILADPASPYNMNGDRERTREAVLALLSPGTNQHDNAFHKFLPEMTNDEFHEFMVWHRGLAIPRARELNNVLVQRGKKLFTEIGCAECHRPKWQTGDDNHWKPACMADKALPRYKRQTIYPYTDLMHHKLFMVNDIHGSWCRTTPLWGRGLSLRNTGAEDRLHDCRARNEVEAIMWHCYSPKSHAYESAHRFYLLPKEDRRALIRFIRAI